jgi:hypothetical protein
MNPLQDLHSRSMLNIKIFEIVPFLHGIRHFALCLHTFPIHSPQHRLQSLTQNNVGQRGNANLDLLRGWRLRAST